MGCKQRAKIKRLLDRAADLLVQADELADEYGWPDRQTMILHGGAGLSCAIYVYENYEARDRDRHNPETLILSKIFKGIDVGAA